MADFTVGTMADLIGFEGCALALLSRSTAQVLTVTNSIDRHLNSSAPFSLKEYNAVWKSPNYAPWNITEYPDFKVCPALNNTI